MNHGRATLKKDYKHLQAGEHGIITAYLPADNIFAVAFSDIRVWIAFELSLQEFEELFEIKLN